MSKPGKDGAIPPIQRAPVQVERVPVQVVGRHAVDGDAGVVVVILKKSP